MYIPITFFGAQGSCVEATTTILSGTGSISSGSFISGGFVWDYWKFDNTTDVSSGQSASFSASFNVISGSSAQSKLLIVAGGGGGGGTPCFNFGDCGYFAAGGGGGGGIVYYNNFTISSGSYELSVGAGGGPGTGDTGFTVKDTGGVTQKIAQNGQPSYFINKYEYTPFTSSILIANGGGGGAQWLTYIQGGTPTSQSFVTASNGGSGGGAARGYNEGGDVAGGDTNGPGLGGINGINQGNSGGDCITGTGWVNNGGAGGGSALATGSSVIGGTTPYVTKGADAITFNLTGTPTYFSAGGAGFADDTLASSSIGYDGIGSGGNGGGKGWFAGQHAPQPGKNGSIIIAIPKCLSAFDCTTFNITGSNTTLSYLPCGFPFVTQSRLSSISDTFTACLVTYAGTNTPVLLTGTTTSSAVGDCSAQLTSSTGNCDCNFVRAIAGSGTQTFTYFPCNGSGSITESVNTSGKYFCLQNGSEKTLTGEGSTILQYGACNTGSCGGVSYTSSIVNCSSILVTAGISGSTVTYLPCGSSSAATINLSGSESRSICGAYTSSFYPTMTGTGNTIQVIGGCSYQFPPAIVSWSFDEVNQNGTFTITNGPTTIVTLTADGSGNIAISGSKELAASLAPVAYAGTSGSLFMNLNISGSNVNISRNANTNTTISASLLMEYGQTYFISSSIRWDAFPAVTASMASYIDIALASSYNGSGSIIQDLTSNNNDATIASSSYWVYDTSSLSTPVLMKNTIGANSQIDFADIATTTSGYTLLLSWYGKNPSYSGPNNDAPLFYDKDQDPGNNQYGMTAFASSVGVAIANGDTPINLNVSSSANIDAWHISQISLNGTTGTGSYCLDGITGSYTGSGIANPLQFSIFGNKLTAVNSGFGSGSMMQVAVIYTSSLSTQQMLDNYNALKNRYGL